MKIKISISMDEELIPRLNKIRKGKPVSNIINLAITEWLDHIEEELKGGDDNGRK